MEAIDKTTTNIIIGLHQLFAQISRRCREWRSVHVLGAPLYVSNTNVMGPTANITIFGNSRPLRARCREQVPDQFNESTLPAPQIVEHATARDRCAAELGQLQRQCDGRGQRRERPGTSTRARTLEQQPLQLVHAPRSQRGSLVVVLYADESAQLVQSAQLHAHTGQSQRDIFTAEPDQCAAVELFA